MGVDIYKMVGWFYDKRGKLTYSMYGSRNGADGTADCSGSVTQAIYSAGGKAYNYLYSTVTIGAYLAVNGFERIAVNQDWEAKFGDVVLMSWGKDMSTSGGAGGHIGVMDSATNFISVDYWTGGQAKTAVSEHNWNDYYNTEVSNGLQYVEVWRYNGKSQAAQSTNNNAPKVPVSGAVDQILNVGEYFSTKKAYRIDHYEYVNGVEQVISEELAGGSDWDWTNNGWGLKSFEIVDKNGNIQNDQSTTVGKYMQLHNPNRIRVAEVDPDTNGIGIDTRYGRIWASAATFTEVK